jgi:hypothetical protein
MRRKGLVRPLGLFELTIETVANRHKKDQSSFVDTPRAAWAAASRATGTR